MRIGRFPSRQSGLTYLAVLFFVAATGAMLAATATIWSRERQREKEQELLWIGNQFREAIGFYYQRTPGTLKRFPEKLEDLLEDRRHLTRQRYLRKLYRDPMTGEANWKPILAPEGGIMGIASTSDLSPLRSNFSDSDLRNASRYSQWRFVYDVQAQRMGRPLATR
jgi:hypothetical protein